ncbi:MAG: ABC-F family ATP-binding cassette domain-containing protein [Acidimicrobiales bacterium]|nr:ABC-F family ATP-binding cassette domain-containing protein [Acidimicrobiales bacterium]MDG1876585.1 ABC-F family ATP-binding cassette domain-containing protein [Acidimicrobiales bacterium]
MLTASGIARSYGPRDLFTDVTLQLSAGRRIALVGGNGTGKTSLIEILVGDAEPDAGSITRPRDMTLGYLPQDLVDTATGSVIEEVLAGAGDMAALAEDLHRLEAQLTDPPPGVDYDTILTNYGDVQGRFESMGGYALEADAHKVLAGLGFKESDTQRPVRELSGGWRMRVALARLLLASPDVLILDEPTNHLDVDSVAWLEQQLAAWPGALLFVSHDRDFIDAVADRVVELAEGTALEYVGGFAEFVVQREERLQRLEAAAARQAREVARVEQFIDRFRYKATKARQVQSRIKTLEKLDAIAVPNRKEIVAKFAFPEPPRSSRVVAEFNDATVGYGDIPVVRNVTLAVERGANVALIGPNGAGKTTLLKLILGELEASEGRAELGNNVSVAKFHQHQADELDLDKTVIAAFSGGIDPGKRNMRTVLGSFGFPGDAAERRINDLSGGERTRLALARTMIEPVNLLVLDEPTNHLDLPSCDVLEDALTAYPGTVLLVTHDRHLIRNVADAIIDVRNGQATWYDGVPEEILTPADPSKVASANAGLTKPTNARAEQRRASATDRQTTNNLRKSVQKLEKALERAEAEVAELQAQLADPALYDRPEDVHRLATAHEKAKDKAVSLMERWEAAAEQLETGDG